MAVWRLTEFEAVLLPRYNAQADLTGGRLGSSLQDTVNGTHDTWAGLTRVPRAPVFSMQGIYAEDDVITPAEVWVTESGDTIVTEDGDRMVFVHEAILGATSALEQLNTLLAMKGKEGSLTRVETLDDTNVQIIPARLLDVRHVTNPKFHGRMVQIDCIFEALDDPFWTDDDEQSETGLTLNATIGGTAPVLDAVLDITGAIASSCTISGAGHDLTWTGALGGGQHLIISRNGVTANGVASSVTWGSNHDYNRLLQLEPGDITLTITGAAGATLTWKNKWH